MYVVDCGLDASLCNSLYGWVPGSERDTQNCGLCGPMQERQLCHHPNIGPLSPPTDARQFKVRDRSLFMTGGTESNDVLHKIFSQKNLQPTGKDDIIFLYRLLMTELMSFTTD